MEDLQIDSERFETSTPRPDKPRNPQDRPFRRLKNFVRTHHTRLVVVLGLLVILPAAVWAYLESTKPVERVSQEVNVKKPAPKPQTAASPLSGLQVDPALAARPVTAVVIENHTGARPQSGLSDAGVVYEALAEGGITRFLAFYLENRPKELGPVRSLRTYFVDWALEFNAPVAHAGGNADALDLVGPLGMKDMNQFAYGGYFYRTADRFAPHNLYTTSDQLDQLEARLGYNKPASFKPSPRKKDTPSAQPSHPVINVNYSYNGYQVEYKYNAGCNCYDRLLAGSPQIDRNTGAAIQVKNVVVEYMPTSYGTTRIGEQTVIMGTPGSGRAIVFTDGGAVEGTWSKASHTERTRLLDGSGKDIPLNAGSTWYSIVPPDRAVNY